MLLRMAMLFAFTDLVHVIEVRHVRAALVWTRFHRDSVRFIFNDAAGEEAARESSDAAGKILDYLRRHGQTSRSDLLLSKCFAGHLSAQRMDEALDSLLLDSPPRIEVVDGPQLDNGKRPKLYRSLSGREVGELAKLPMGTGQAQVRTPCESGELEMRDTSNFAKFAKIAQ